MIVRSIRTRFADLAESIRSLGPGNYLLYAISRIGTITGLPISVFRYLFVAQPVRSKPVLPERRGVDIKVRQAKADDPCFSDLPLDAGVLEYRFRQNTICFVASRRDEVLGCLWLCFDAYDEDEVRCRFVLDPPDEVVWDYDIYVHPDARSSFAFLRLWDTANAYLHHRGYAWSLSRISAFNPGSMQSHGSLGARKIGSATFVRMGNAQLLLSGMSPFVYLSLGPKGAPEMTLSASQFE